jgi:hypothetical protein
MGSKTLCNACGCKCLFALLQCCAIVADPDSALVQAGRARYEKYRHKPSLIDRICFRSMCPGWSEARHPGKKRR